jgi:hypothetical protein
MNQNLIETLLIKAVSEFITEPGMFVIRGEPKYENIEWSPNFNGTPPTKLEVEDRVKELISDEPMRRLRYHRDRLLQKCDWVTLPDVNLSEEKKAAWLEYRQALRNLPDTANPELDGPFVKNVEWPQEP